QTLRDIRAAFGDDAAVRSANLVAKLIADPERPWAEWKHERPLTQKQLGGLLRPFGIVSETVSIPGFNDAKGYRRTRFEEVWEVYCPGQNSSAADFSLSKRRSVETPMKSAQVRDFRSVAEPPGDGSKNGKLPYSHAGFDASTDRKSVGGGKEGFDQGSGHDRPAPGAFTDAKGRPTADPEQRATTVAPRAPSLRRPTSPLRKSSRTL